MENIYYTPEIEDLHVGLECEITYDKNGKRYNFYGEPFEDIYWIPSILESSNIEYFERDKDFDIRVKCLDKDDIESLGFILETTSYGLQYKKDKNIIKFSHNKDLIIEKYFEDIGINSVVFMGEIKNKSELKKILKRLNILYNAIKHKYKYRNNKRWRE